MNSNMTNEELSPDADIVEEDFGLTASQKRKSAKQLKNVGRRCIFKDPIKAGGGTCRTDAIQKIIGLQRIHDGSIAYRVVTVEWPVGNPFKDNFGMPMRFEQAKFID